MIGEHGEGCSLVSAVMPLAHLLVVRACVGVLGAVDDVEPCTAYRGGGCGF